MIGTRFQISALSQIGFRNERQLRPATIGRLALTVAILIGGHVTSAIAALPPNYVNASFDVTKQLLTVTGDDGGNQISITRQQNGLVTISAFGQTRIGNSGSFVTTLQIPYTNSTFSVNATLNGGDDYVVFTTVLSPKITLSMGSGNDYAQLTYCSVTTLSLDGGAGTNTLAELGSKVTTPMVTNVQVKLPLF